MPFTPHHKSVPSRPKTQKPKATPIVMPTNPLDARARIIEDAQARMLNKKKPKRKK